MQARIDGYLDELHDMMVLLGDKQSLTGEQKGVTQGQMKSLKERMRADPNPGVKKAILHFHRAWTTDPIKSKWIHQLGVVHSDLNLYRYRMFGLKKNPNTV